MSMSHVSSNKFCDGAHLIADCQHRGHYLGKQLFQLGTVCLQLCNLMAQTAHGLHAQQA